MHYRLVAALLGLVFLSVSHSSAEARSNCSSLESCEKACATNDAAACYEAADMQRRGYGAEPNRSRAVELFSASCTQEYALACVELAEMFTTGWMFEVPTDSSKSEAARKRARSLMERGCAQDSDPQDCYALALTQFEAFESAGLKDTEKPKLGETIALFEKSCKDGEGSACDFLWDKGTLFYSLDLIKREESKRLQSVAVAEAGKSCMSKSPDLRSCVLAGKEHEESDEAMKMGAIACKAGLQEGCWVEGMRLADEMDEPKVDDPETTRILNKLINSCDGPGHKDCEDVAEALAEGIDDILKPDVKRAVGLMERQCQFGNRQACENIAEVLLEEEIIPKHKSNRTRAIKALAKDCSLSRFGSECEVCKLQPDHPQCNMRNAWEMRNECVLKHNMRQCQSLGTMFRNGEKVERDVTLAAGFYRTGCIGSMKNSCASLRDMCDPAGDRDALSKEICEHSLIHSDVFYEAEWQYRRTGQYSIQGEHRESEPTPTMQMSQTATASAGVQLKRGSLDADLVVSIVLDRARQAALRLVVDELKRAGRAKKLPTYLNDLLTQAALLLADSSTLRREKFQDLAMTVVRAFIASNLVQTLYPTDADLMSHQVWKTIGLESMVDADVRAHASFVGPLRSYLTDWTYFYLGQESLFARDVRVSSSRPKCPFSIKSHKKICELLSGESGVELLADLLRVDDALKGLRLAKLIMEQDGVDLRRFIEALSKSDMVASLESTPGLNMEIWETELRKLENRVLMLAPQFQAMRRLTSMQSYTSVSINWQHLESAAKKVRLLMQNDAFGNLFSAADVSQALKLTDIVLDVRPSASPLGTSEDPRPGLVKTHLEKWDREGNLSALPAKISELHSKIPSLGNISPLLKDIENLRAYMRNNEAGTMRLDELQLHSLGEVQAIFVRVLKHLKDLTEEVQEFPGASVGQFQFAQGAVIRLLSFFDLMDRVARRARLGQSIGEVTSAVKLLGSMQGKRFSAPLFEIMEPILTAIETHRPIDADLLFAIISRVRLDSLITTLASAKAEVNPCQKDDATSDCWAVKVIHALQESIQKEGSTIRIDGGKFATRLASHGDDFRRRHKGGHFFHLTIGIGGLYSQNPPAADGGKADSRIVPLVAEQIGLGWASPTFWGDHFTAKVGGYASGILYRAVVDSVESDAITLGAFAAVDVYDLIELYAAPGIMVYPPIGDTKVGAKFGMSFGLQVPLGSYLERLSD